MVPASPIVLGVRTKATPSLFRNGINRAQLAPRRLRDGGAFVDAAGGMMLAIDGTSSKTAGALVSPRRPPVRCPRAANGALDWAAAVGTSALANRRRFVDS